MQDKLPKAIIPHEGWHCLHLFYAINYSAWQEYPSKTQENFKLSLSQLIQKIANTKKTQIVPLCMITPKADIGFMLITPDLHDLLKFEKQLNQSLGAGVLEPTYYYMSLTEISEYGTTDEEFSQSLEKEKDLKPGTKKHSAAMDDFQKRMEKYRHQRAYPDLPKYQEVNASNQWQVFCFYNMAKKREGADNWYMLDYETRRILMKSHGELGRKWTGKIRQIITGSTGLDEAEWGVTLFGHNTFDIKQIVYEMRFDEVSARYGEFGDFFIGIVSKPEDILAKLSLK